MSSIDDLKAKVQSLTAKLADAEKALDAAMIEAHPVKVGMTGFSGPGAVMVTGLRVRYGHVRVYGRKKTKTGWHAVETELYRGFTPDVAP